MKTQRNEREKLRRQNEAKKKLNATNQVVERYLFKLQAYQRDDTHTHTLALHVTNTQHAHTHVYTPTNERVWNATRRTHTNTRRREKKSCARRCRIAFINDFQRRARSVRNARRRKFSSSSRMAVEISVKIFDPNVARAPIFVVCCADEKKTTSPHPSARLPAFAIFFYCVNFC